MNMEIQRKVICAGCNNKFFANKTVFYRNKRWCGNDLCKITIDNKVKHSNYKKAQKKIKKGTFRHGVDPITRERIKVRDNNVCQSCLTKSGYSRFQVHHIIPVANGGDDDDSNLILLCMNCHNKVHQTGWENYTEQFFNYTGRDTIL